MNSQKGSFQPSSSPGGGEDPDGRNDRRLEHQSSRTFGLGRSTGLRDHRPTENSSHQFVTHGPIGVEDGRTQSGPTIPGPVQIRTTDRYS